ncbi:hypothetical protein ACOMHN_056372 [Nucella lapillus]
MADEQQQETVSQTHSSDPKTDTADDVRGQSPEIQEEPRVTQAAEPKSELPPKDEEDSQSERSSILSEPKAEPSKAEPSKEEPTQKSEESPKEEPKKEEPKKLEPPKTESPKRDSPRKQETKKEEQKSFKPEPKKEQTRRQQDGRGKGDEESTVSRRRQKVEFFKEELKRLQEYLKRESTKIVPPKRRDYKPFIFNTLEPYYNTHTTRLLVEMPGEAEQLASFTCSSRSTALGLIDPWTDLRMGQEILPQISSRPTTRSDLKSRGRKEGSTRLPKFPVVAIETKDLVSKQLYYNDVPTLCKELKTKYSAQAQGRRAADYKRTQQDFYRMDLDRMDQVPEGNRGHLTSTYMAYLNTPGSRRALNECVRTMHGKAH